MDDTWGLHGPSQTKQVHPTLPVLASNHPSYSKFGVIGHRPTKKNATKSLVLSIVYGRCSDRHLKCLQCDDASHSLRPENLKRSCLGSPKMKQLWSLKIYN